MKNIKDCLITSKEGFSVENLQRFPSMEWGDEGGLQADLLYKGDKIMTVFNEGNGGCAVCHTTELYSTKMGEIKSAALDFLKRKDKNWDKYDFLRDKTYQDIDDDDFEGVVLLIEERFDDIKAVSKFFNEGFKSVGIAKNDLKTIYLRYRVEDISNEEVRDYLDKNLAKDNYTDVEIVRKSDNICVY